VSASAASSVVDIRLGPMPSSQWWTFSEVYGLETAADVLTTLKRRSFRTRGRGHVINDDEDEAALNLPAFRAYRVFAAAAQEDPTTSTEQPPRHLFLTEWEPRSTDPHLQGAEEMAGIDADAAHAASDQGAARPVYVQLESRGDAWSDDGDNADGEREERKEPTPEPRRQPERVRPKLKLLPRTLPLPSEASPDGGVAGRTTSNSNAAAPRRSGSGEGTAAGRSTTRTAAGQPPTSASSLIALLQDAEPSDEEKSEGEEGGGAKVAQMRASAGEVLAICAEDEWQCLDCTLINNNGSLTCAACGSSRPEDWELV